MTQFINYVLRVQSTQQLFIVAPALFKILLHTEYLPWYIPWYGRDCNYWSVVKTTGFSNYLFSLLKLSKTFYWPFKRHTIFKNICSEAWPASATLQSNNCRGPPPQHACYPLCTHVLPTFSWKCDTTQSKNAFIENFLVGSTATSRQKWAWLYFHILTI